MRLCVHCILSFEVEGGKISGSSQQMTDGLQSESLFEIGMCLCVWHTAEDSYVTLSVQHQTSSFQLSAVPCSQTWPTFHRRGTKCLWKRFRGLRPHLVLILIEHKYVRVFDVCGRVLTLLGL